MDNFIYGFVVGCFTMPISLVLWVAIVNFLDKDEDFEINFPFRRTDTHNDR